ncbi:MAG: hypothetical protein EOP56_12110 [Sphingobacteriales bacterium]|nr:MAG: hypothetical protein EOP56_12110 [Sphingobacteriales bacterium]
MSTSPLTIRQITQLLESPELIAAVDKANIAQLNEQYPYFGVGRYMQAARRHMGKPFSPDMMTGMQLYRGNWIFFHQFLNQSAKGVQTYAAYNKDLYESTTTDEFSAAVIAAAPVSRPEEGYIPEAVTEESEVTTPTPQAVEEKPDVDEEVYDDEAPIEMLDVEAQIEASAQQHEHAQQEPEDNADRTYTAESDVMGEGLQQPTQQEVEKEDKHNHHSHVAETIAAAKDDNGRYNQDDTNLVPPVYVEDYFRHEGVQVPNDIPDSLRPATAIPFFHDDNVDEDKSLIVVRGFSEWLMHLKRKQENELSEEEDKKALKAMWQKEKLAAAMEEDEEDEEIPENVFEMAVNSITQEEGLISDSLAEVLEKQGKHDKAIDMYRKLSLRNPQKNAYFADKIEKILKQQKGT